MGCRVGGTYEEKNRSRENHSLSCLLSGGGYHGDSFYLDVKRFL